MILMRIICNSAAHDVPAVMTLMLIFAQMLVKAVNVRLFYVFFSSLKSALTHSVIGYGFQATAPSPSIGWSHDLHLGQSHQ